SFASLLHRLRRLAGATGRARRLGPQATTPGRALRPRLEVLEDRLAPAVFTVANSNDSGAGSLRQAILSANATPGTNNINFGIGGDVVSGNYLGTSRAGDAGAANGFSGVSVVNGGGNQITGNLISGNTEFGVFLYHTAGNLVAGNLIGINAADNAAVANGCA